MEQNQKSREVGMLTTDQKASISKLQRHIFVAALIVFTFFSVWLSQTFPNKFKVFVATSPDMFWIQWSLVFVSCFAFLIIMSRILASIIVRSGKVM